MLSILNTLHPGIAIVSGVLALILLFLYINLLLKLKKSKVTKKDKENDGSLRKFELAVEMSTDSIVITDKQANIIYVNKAWERLTGYKKEEVLGKNPRILKSGKTADGVYKELWSTLTGSQPFVTEELINKRKDGSLYNARLEVFPIVEAGKVMYVGIENDITERKGGEDAKTEFVSLASHQLRTPLSVIDWYTETLLSGSAGSLNDKQKNYVQELYKTNKHMMNLVDMLLNTSRLELGTFSVAPEPTNTVQIAKSVLQELQPKITAKNLTVNTELDEKIPTIRIDKNIVRIVIQNLVSNAVRYTSSGGSVWFSMKFEKTGNKVKDRFISTDSILITVQDTGIGIPESEKGKIFSKLFRAQNAREHHAGGTGLGLYIVKAILDQTNGDIWFESEEGVGSTFYIVMPVRGMHSGEKISVISHIT